MQCEKCLSKLNYKDKYCSVCGEKINIKDYEKDYNKTVWGILDKISDWWEIIQLKKFTDHWITKLLILTLILGWGLFDIYSEYTNIKLLESDNYKIEYNKKLDEYYIRTPQNEVNINMYIPGHSDKITVKEYENNKITGEKVMLKEEYSKTPVTLEKGKYDYILVNSQKLDKTTDTVKLYITD